MFKNKTALITGAAAGIGKACAIRFAEEGANVILVDVNTEMLTATEKEVKAITDNVVAYTCDVTDNHLVCSVVEKAVERFGKIDVLVNNAALWRSWLNFMEISFEEWETYFSVNVMGTVYFTKAVLAHMLENQYGRIVNVASVAGIYGNPKMTHYSATKGAVISFTKALAKEVADQGITVNAVSPGTVSPAWADDIDFVKENDMCYAGRTGSTRENADLICFLASDKATYINGQNIQIDGCRKKI